MTAVGQTGTGRNSLMTGGSEGTTTVSNTFLTGGSESLRTGKYRKEQPADR